VADNQENTDEAMAGREVGVERSVLGRIDSPRSHSRTRGCFSLARTRASSATRAPPSAADAQMRIVEAQSRSEHGSPVRSTTARTGIEQRHLSQVEVVQRLLDRDEQLARAELKQLREVLTRELRGVRAYLSSCARPSSPISA